MQIMLRAVLHGAACGLLLLICGCIRFGFDNADSEKSPFGQGTWVLGAPQPVEELSSDGWDGEVFLLRDGRTVYISSSRNGGQGETDIYRATRADRSSPFGQLESLELLNTRDQETLSVTHDGHTAFLATDRTGSTGLVDIWVGTRDDTAAPWSRDLFLLNTTLSSPDNDHDPVPSPDGLRVYFAPKNWTGEEPAGQDIAVARRPALDAPFETPELIDMLNTDHSDSDPTISPDERVIVFTSWRAEGVGERDLWYVVRPTRFDAFSEPQLMPVVNSPYDEGEAFISADGTELYFNSDRPGGMGDDDIYRAPILAGP